MHCIKPYLCSYKRCKGCMNFFVQQRKSWLFFWSCEVHDTTQQLLGMIPLSFWIWHQCTEPFVWGVRGACRSAWPCVVLIYEALEELLHFHLYWRICNSRHHKCAAASVVRAFTHTCLLSDTSCVSSCRTVSTPASWEADRVVMSPCSRCMPLGGLRRALSGWWRYWAPMLSFFTGPERLGVALSELVLLGFCFTACADRYYTNIRHQVLLKFYLFTRTTTPAGSITFMYNKWSTNWTIG